MAQTASSIDELTLSITQQIQVNAPPDTTFAALLEEMGPHNEGPDGTPLPMHIEARPGGRWYRDLGHDNGHLWGHGQAIKRSYGIDSGRFAMDAKPPNLERPRTIEALAPGYERIH